ncbi:MAG TPA: T9SS type A sorting domain-containing protein, partial [Bacteroidota bacterium]|nr:T9SS type A sorting domain-containing protein [Bacteroidota bacterium]
QHGTNLATHTHTHKGVRVLAGLAIFTMILCCLLAHEAVGQKEWTTRPVVIAEGQQVYPSVARPSQLGFTIVVWEDTRAGGSGADVYIQKIDNATGLPMWLPPDGLPVCTAPGAQQRPRAAYDSLGGVIVVWEDYRSGGASASVFAQRLNVFSGALDPNWPANGAPVCNLPSHAEHVRIAGTADGAFVSWLDYRGYDPATRQGRAVYMQYILGANGSWPQGLGYNWQLNGIPVSANPGLDQEHPELARDWIWRTDAGLDIKAGAVVTYQNLVYRAGQPIWQVMANNMDADGTRRYNGVDVALAVEDADQLKPRIVCSGAEQTADQPRAIVTWQDARENPAAPLFHIYAQIIDANGAVQNPQGEPICDNPESQINPVPALWERPYDPNTGDPYIPFVTIAWEDLRDEPLTATDVYAACIDARFVQLVNPGGNGGDPICQSYFDQTEVAIEQLWGGSNAVIAWTTPESGGAMNNIDVHYQMVDVRNWQLDKPVNGWPVVEAKGEQIRPEISNLVFVFQDHRRTAISGDARTDWDIYCQTPGECTGPKAMGWRDMFAKVTTVSDAELYRTVTDDEHNVYVVWDEVRDPVEGRQIFVQKFDKDGVARWTNGGVRVSDVHPQYPTGNAKYGDVAIDMAGGAQVTWQETGANGEQVMYAWVPVSGTITSQQIITVRQVPVNGSLGHIEPRIVKMGQSTRNGLWGPGAVVVYLDSLANGERRRFVARLKYSPSVDFCVDNNFIEPAPMNRFFGLEIAEDGDGGVLVLSRNENAAIGLKMLTVARIGEVFGNFILAGQDNAFPFDDFAGYDIAADLMWPAPHRAMVACALDFPGNLDLLVLSYTGANPSAAGRIAGFPWAYGGVMDPRQPAIVSDHFDMGTYGGMLLAWDLEYSLPGGQRVHSVFSEHVYFFNNGGWALASWPSGNPLQTSGQLAATSRPDIEVFPSSIPGQEPRAMIVWEGGGETSSCVPPRPTEIYTQLAGYDGALRGLYLNQERMVAPGGGNYHQRRPTIARSEDEHFTVFWMDESAGAANPMGTRMFQLSDQLIDWWKQHPATTVDDFRVLVYPNPVHDAAGQVHVRLESPSGGFVRVRLMDMLGRVLSQVYEGELAEGTHTLHTSLPAVGGANGTFFISVETATRRTLHRILLLK